MDVEEAIQRSCSMDEIVTVVVEYPHKELRALRTIYECEGLDYTEIENGLDVWATDGEEMTWRLYLVTEMDMRGRAFDCRCGGAAWVYLIPSCNYCVVCSECYDGPDYNGAPDVEPQIVGTGETLEEAAREWNKAQCEALVEELDCAIDTQRGLLAECSGGMHPNRRDVVNDELDLLQERILRLEKELSEMRKATGIGR